MKEPDWSEIDQANAAIADMFPTCWWGLYKGCVDKGFTPEESLRLVITYIETTLRRLS